jgi:hypothetical protein
MKNKAIKIFTLVSFLALITVFVIYKSGFFTDKKSEEINSLESFTKNVDLDTIPHIDSMLKSKPIISSSKSIIILNPEDFKSIEIDSINLDSIKN